MGDVCDEWRVFGINDVTNGLVLPFLCVSLLPEMKKDVEDTIKVRVTSTAYVALALAVFKPFGLSAWQWEAYVHLLNIFVLGVVVCMFTDLVLKYVVKMPQTKELGVDYIIRRNLIFQLINTPLVALMICLYRHFLLSSRVESNTFSLTNFLETLLIIAFCSFAIGFYWRFKFRSRYLTAELEETRSMNEQLQKMQQQAEQLAKAGETKTDSLTEGNQSAIEADATMHDVTQAQPLPDQLKLVGSTSETVDISISHLLYIEAVGNYVKVYQVRDGKVRNDMLRSTLKQLEDDLRAYPTIVRCHRAFLVNLQQVEQILSKSGNLQLYIKHCHEYLPVSRTNAAQIKGALR